VAQTTEPSSPTDGLIWVDTDGTALINQLLRWSKATANGTTTLSGNDDNSVPLTYSVGYEQVFQNGALLARGGDYTATSGTSISLTNASVTGDIFEVFAAQPVAISDVYTQTQANAAFINDSLLTTTGDTIYASGANTPARLGIGTSGQVLSVSGGVPAWATVSSGAMTQIADTTLTTSTADITFSSIPSTYNHLKVVISGTAATASYNGAAFYVQVNGDSGANYSFSTNTKYAGPGATVTLEGQNSQTQIELGNIWCGQAQANSISSIEMTFFNYKATTLHKGMVFTGGSWTDAPGFGSGWARWKNTAAITSIKLYSNAGNHATGTRATLYGWT
jgi:hypothetical protein